MPKLQLEDRLTRETAVLWISGDERITIGRSLDNDVTIPIINRLKLTILRVAADEETKTATKDMESMAAYISRRPYVEIFCLNGDLYLEPTEEGNLVYVDDKLLVAKERAPLPKSCLLKLGYGRYPLQASVRRSLGEIVRALFSR